MKKNYLTSQWFAADLTERGTGLRQVESVRWVMHRVEGGDTGDLSLECRTGDEANYVQTATAVNLPFFLGKQMIDLADQGFFLRTGGRQP